MQAGVIIQYLNSYFAGGLAGGVADCCEGGVVNG